MMWSFGFTGNDVLCERAASEIYIYGLVMVSTGIMKLEKRVARDALNSKLKIKR